MVTLPKRKDFDMGAKWKEKILPLGQSQKKRFGPQENAGHFQ